jgi:rhodanese-related sulfurtransferase
MPQLLEFVTNHFLLVGAFGGVLIALLWTLASGFGSNALSPQQGVMLMNREQALPLDVRNATSYRAGHIINAINIELSELPGAATKIEKYKALPVIVYCDAGTSSAQAAKKLRQVGFTKVYQLQGGLSAWRSDNLPLEASK